MARRAAPTPVLGPLEAQVMELLWQEREASVRAVLDALNAASDAPRAYTTVMTVMHALERKSLATRRRRGRYDVFRPKLSRTTYIDRRAEADVDALVRRYGDAAYGAFARALKASPAPSDRATAPSTR